MRQVFSIVLLMVLSLTSGAQYKKVGFFSPSGRSLGFAVTSYIMGDGKEMPLGFSYTGSREKEDKRTFTFGALTIIPPYKFSYQTTATSSQGNDEQIMVAGKSIFQIAYDFNFGYFLLSTDNKEGKVKPYISFGVNVVSHFGGSEFYDYPLGYNDIKKKVAKERSYKFGARAGVGTIYLLTKRLSLKADAGYMYMIKLKDPNLVAQGAVPYHLFSNNLAVSAGVRFTLSAK